MIARTLLSIGCLCLILRAGTAAAQTGDNILLISNSLSQASDEISEYYARKRGVPNEQILRFPLPTSEEIDRATFESKIQGPIALWLTARAAQDRILYIVLTKDVPLRIGGNSGQNGTVASVDSELALLYRRMTGTAVPTNGPIKNPLFIPDRPTATATTPFTHRDFDIYLVGRLDGYSAADVKSMIDRGSAPARDGNIVLDGKLELGLAVGNKWLEGAATAVRRLPGWADRVTLDTGQATITNQENVLGFYTWGSNAVMATARRFGHQFLPGALAAEYVSTDARTFREPPDDWAINDDKKLFAGSHQSLIGDLIRDGVTGTAGHVAEPFLNGTIRPDALFPAYLSGSNLIESFYGAMPSLSWQTVVIGDPLCAPFSRRRSPEGELNPSVDPATEMPQYFSGRRLTVISSSGAKPEAARWLATADVRSSRRDGAGVREALERAIAIDPEYTPAYMTLARIYEQTAEWDAAIASYRKIIEKRPTNAIALNNLAYALAVRKGNPAEALPFAVRAYSLSVQDPTIGDTLAWIHHLRGDDSLAEPIMTLAARRIPNVAEVQLHAAFILAGTGRLPQALEALNAAIKLDAALTQQPEVKELQTRLSRPSQGAPRR